MESDSKHIYTGQTQYGQGEDKFDLILLDHFNENNIYVDPMNISKIKSMLHMLGKMSRYSDFASMLRAICWNLEGFMDDTDEVRLPYVQIKMYPRKTKEERKNYIDNHRDIIQTCQRDFNKLKEKHKDNLKWENGLMNKIDVKLIENDIKPFVTEDGVDESKLVDNDHIPEEKFVFENVASLKRNIIKSEMAKVKRLKPRVKSKRKIGPKTLLKSREEKVLNYDVKVMDPDDELLEEVEKFISTLKIKEDIILSSVFHEEISSLKGVIKELEKIILKLIKKIDINCELKELSWKDILKNYGEKPTTKEDIKSDEMKTVEIDTRRSRVAMKEIEGDYDVAVAREIESDCDDDDQSRSDGHFSDSD